MRRKVRSTIFTSFMAAALLGMVPGAMAAYPDRPVTLINSNGPGGPVDILARLLAQKLGERWGQSVVVENRPGGSGIIATNAVASADPDGYTLGMVVASTVTIVPHAVNELPYDAATDLAPVAIVAKTPFVFVVPADSELQTWEDFVKHGREGDLAIGSFSVGTAFHLVWEQVSEAIGVDVVYVPSPTPGKTQADLLSGRLDIALDSPSSSKGLIDGGKLKPLAVTSLERFSGLPDTPTLAELGAAGELAEPWIGMMATGGTPPEVIAIVNETLNEVLEDPATQKQMQAIGMIPVGGTPAELEEAIARDDAAMKPLVEALEIRL